MATAAGQGDLTSHPLDPATNRVPTQPVTGLPSVPTASPQPTSAIARRRQVVDDTVSIMIDPPSHASTPAATSSGAGRDIQSTAGVANPETPQLQRASDVNRSAVRVLELPTPQPSARQERVGSASDVGIGHGPASPFPGGDLSSGYFLEDSPASILADHEYPSPDNSVHRDLKWLLEVIPAMRDDQPLREWWRDVEAQARLHRITQLDLITFVRMRVAPYLRVHCANFVTSSLPALLAHLERREPPSSYLDVFDRLRDLRQRGSLIDYEREFHTLRGRINIPLGDAVVRDTYIRGLHPDLRARLPLSVRQLSYSEVSLLASQAWALLEQDRAMAASATLSRSTEIHQDAEETNSYGDTDPEYTAAALRRPPPRPSHTSRPPNARYPAERATQGERRVRCFLCEQEGHEQQQCVLWGIVRAFRGLNVSQDRSPRPEGRRGRPSRRRGGGNA